MNKQNLSILLINDKESRKKNIVKDIFMKHGPIYDLIVFPPKILDPESRIQIVFFRYNLIERMESLFPVMIDYDMDDPPDFFDFDLIDIEEDAFYDILMQEYLISIKSLSEIEK